MNGDWRERRKERIVKNELRFREHNERRSELEGLAASSEPVPFLCECGDSSCLAVIELSADEYEAAHRTPEQFVVLRGHEKPDVERIVERHAGWDVVEKLEPVEE